VRIFASATDEDLNEVTVRNYFFVVGAVFAASLIEGSISGNIRVANYAVPLLLVLGLSVCSPNLRLAIPAAGLPVAVFYAWLGLSLLFTLLVYENKAANVLNILSIALINFAAIAFLKGDKWRLFLDALVTFLIVFVCLNLAFQLLLPRSWGSFLFATQTGLTAETTNFAYVTFAEALPFQPDMGPLSLPAFRNHGVAFVAGLLAIAGLSMALCAQTKGNKTSSLLPPWLLFTFGFVLCFLTESRGVLLGLILVLAAAHKYANNRALLALFALVASTYLLVFEWEAVAARLGAVFRVADTVSETVTGRAGLWKLHATLITERPWTGWGWKLPYEAFSYDADTQPTTESGLTFTLASQGLLRGGLYIGLFALAFWRWRCIGGRDWHSLFLQFVSIFLFVGFVTLGWMVTVTSAIACISQLLLAIALFCNSKPDPKETPRLAGSVVNAREFVRQHPVMEPSNP